MFCHLLCRTQVVFLLQNEKATPGRSRFVFLFGFMFQLGSKFLLGFERLLGFKLRAR